MMWSLKWIVGWGIGICKCFFSSRGRHTGLYVSWSSDVCSCGLGNGEWGMGNGNGEWEWGMGDRKSGGEGKSVDIGGRRTIKKKRKNKIKWSWKGVR